MQGPWFGKPSTAQDCCKSRLTSQNLSGTRQSTFWNKKEWNIYLTKFQASLPNVLLFGKQWKRSLLGSASLLLVLPFYHCDLGQAGQSVLEGIDVIKIQGRARPITVISLYYRLILPQSRIGWNACRHFLAQVIKNKRSDASLLEEGRNSLTCLG